MPSRARLKTNMFRAILETSQTEKKSVTLYVAGQTITGIVTALTDEHVELRNREYSRIVVRLEAIDAASMS